MRDKHQEFRNQVASDIVLIKKTLDKWKTSSRYINYRNSIEQSVNKIEIILNDTLSPLKNWDNALVEVITEALEKEEFVFFCDVSLKPLKQTVKNFIPNIIKIEQINTIIEKREDVMRELSTKFTKQQEDICKLENMIHDPKSFKENFIFELQKPIFMQLDSTNKLLESAQEKINQQATLIEKGEDTIKSQSLQVKEQGVQLHNLEMELESQKEKLTDIILSQNNNINEQSIRSIEQNTQINSLANTLQSMKKEMEFLMGKDENRNITPTATPPNSQNRNNLFQPYDVQNVKSDSPCSFNLYTDDI